ncbi:hypothetical protein N9C49_06660 [Gammaproteobacteria bacterium]|nr:hypothetical protein [Gammaproteobacteria bacterium]
MNNNKYLLIIDQIEAVRTKNNKNWMDLLRLAFKYAPEEASEIFNEIFKEDKEVNRLAKELLKRND